MLHTRMMTSLRRISGSGIAAILRYHAIADPLTCDYAAPSICLHPEKFEQQVRHFVEAYNVVSLDTIVACIHDQRPFPEKALALTFDDGYRDNYQAYQIMKKYGIQATFYVSAGYIESAEPLWLAEVIYLVKKTNRPVLEFVVNDRAETFALTSPKQKSSPRRVDEY